MFSIKTLKLIELVKFGYYLRLLPYKVTLNKSGRIEVVLGSKFHYFQHVIFVCAFITFRLQITTWIILYDYWKSNDIQLNERIAAYEACSLFALLIIIHLLILFKGNNCLESWHSGFDLIERAG